MARMSDLEKTKLRRQIIAEKLRRVDEAISRGETLEFGLSVAIHDPAIDLATAYNNAVVLDLAENFRTQDEGGWGGAETKRRWPPALKVIYGFLGYKEAGDYTLEKEAIASMLTLLSGGEGRDPRFSLRGIAELGEILANTGEGHGPAHKKLLAVLDPIDAEKKLLRWSEWCVELMDDTTSVVRGHTKDEEGDLIGRASKSSVYRTVPWVPGIEGGLHKASHGENWYTDMHKPKWSCSSCGSPLIEFGMQRPKLAGRIKIRKIECPTCSNPNIEKISELNRELLRGPHESEARSLEDEIWDRKPLTEMEKRRIGTRGMIEARCFIPNDETRNELLMVHDGDSCPRCYVNPWPRSFGIPMVVISPEYPWIYRIDSLTHGTWIPWHTRFDKIEPEVPPKLRSARSNVGWCEVCHDYTASKPVMKKRKSTMQGEWIDPQIEDPDGDDDSESYEDIHEQPLAEIHYLIEQSPRRRDKRDNMWRVAQGIVKGDDHMDIRYGLTRETVSQAKKDLEKILEPYALKKRLIDDDDDEEVVA